MGILLTQNWQACHIEKVEYNYVLVKLCWLNENNYIFVITQYETMIIAQEDS